MLCGSVRSRWRARASAHTPSANECKTLAVGCEKLAKYGLDKSITLRYHPHGGFTIETEDDIDILFDQTKKT